MSRAGVLACLFALLLGSCTSDPSPMAAAERALVKATPTPTEVATDPPVLETEEPEPLPQAEPITLRVDDIQIVSTSHAAMLGVPAAPVDEAAALAAVQASAAQLEAYLNAMFVDVGTRLSPAAVPHLADPAAVGAGGIDGLGVLARDDILGTLGASAAATAQVQLDGGVVGAVSLTYSASVELVLADMRGPVTQQGVAAYVSRGGAMQLTGMEVQTIFGGPLAQELAP